MSPQLHTAKLFALEALEAGRLSPAGTARVLRHLGSCEVCRNVQRGMHVQRALLQDLKTVQPQLDYSRMELALRREARSIAQPVRVAPSALGALALAAVALLVFGVYSHRSAPLLPVAQRATPLAVVAPSVDEGAALQARITALSGRGVVRATSGATRALGLDSVLVEGERIELAPGAEAHVRVAQDTAFIVDDSAVLALTTLREHAVRLALSAGGVTSQVRHLADGERYQVLAAGYTVAVRGTRFRVALDVRSQLTAAVSQGHVVVTRADGTVVSDLIAPARFGVADARSSAAPELTLPAPRSLTEPLATWPALVLPVLHDVRTWTVDGNAFPASAELAMRVPRGDVTLHAQLGNGRTRELVVQVPEGGLHLEAAVLSRMLRALEGPEHAAAGLTPETIRQVITNGTPALQRCYELSMKQRPDIAGRFTLRIAVDPAGQVRRVVPRNTDGPETSMPDGLVDCLGTVAQRWRFPPPGEAVTFDAPIRLMHARVGTGQ